MKGWVYIITNKAMPGLVKVGYSDRDPENRATELNSTASPHPHVVEFAILVDRPKKVEQSIHLKLKDNHEAKEWFKCSVDFAKSAILGDQINAIITHGTNAEKVTSNYKFSAPPPQPSNLNMSCVVCGTHSKFVNSLSGRPLCDSCKRNIGFS